MLLTRLVKDPITKEQAEAQFRRWAVERGYIITGAVRVAWQLELFRSNRLDALVEAEVCKGAHCHSKVVSNNDS